METDAAKRRGWTLVGLGVVVALAAVVAWVALGGFQTGAMGGITEEQQASMDRADGIALPLVVVGAVVAAVGVVHLLVAAGQSTGRR